MNFIDDDELEAVPELIHVPIRTLERGDRQRRPPAHAIAIAPDRAPIQSPDLPEPLIEQDPSRNQTQGTQPRPVHGGESQPRLAAPSRESDDATAVPQLPRGQCGLLIGPEVDLRPQLLRRRYGLRDILESRAAPEKPALQGGILAGGRPVGMDTSVPEDAWGLGEVQILRRIRQHDGPAVELQPHGQRLSGRSPACRVVVPLNPLIPTTTTHANAQRWIRLCADVGPGHGAPGDAAAPSGLHSLEARRAPSRSSSTLDALSPSYGYVL